MPQRRLRLAIACSTQLCTDKPPVLWAQALRLCSKICVFSNPSRSESLGTPRSLQAFDQNGCSTWLCVLSPSQTLPNAQNTDTFDILTSAIFFGLGPPLSLMPDPGSAYGDSYFPEDFLDSICPSFLKHIQATQRDTVIYPCMYI